MVSDGILYDELSLNIFKYKAKCLNGFYKGMQV